MQRSLNYFHAYFKHLLKYSILRAIKGAFKLLASNLRTPGTPRTLKNWEIEGGNWEIKWEKKDQLLLRNHEIIDLSDGMGTQKEKKNTI